MFSKSDEVALLDSTIAGLPDSYVRDILVAEREAILHAISNDLGFIDLIGIQREARVEKESLDALAKRRSAIQQELRDLERQKAVLVNAVTEAKDQAASLSRRLRELV